MKPIIIDATTISDAWFRLLYSILPEDGVSYNQKIQKGSFENNQYRHQIPSSTIFIAHPEQDMVPVI